MKRIYLDWGVVSYLKKDKCAKLRNLLVLNKDRLFLVYSSAHFIVERHRKENDMDSDYVIYKFSNRFLGIFTHGIHYLNSDGSNLLQFKLAFDNFSRFLFYDEVAMIIDTITDYFGLQGISDYDSLRKKFVEGNTDVTISWRFENGFVCVKNDEERHRPELYFMLKPITRARPR